MTQAPNTFWIVAAGTGGHIFPGITLAEEIKRQRPDAKFLFFGTADRLEAKIIPEHGYPIQFLKAGRWKGLGPLARALGLFNLVYGFFQVLWLLWTTKQKPACLVSVGGYVSVPTALACKIFRKPLFLIEPNIRAGLANRILSRFAVMAFTSPGSDSVRLFKCPVKECGSPVRSKLKSVTIRPDVKNILVLGGSQGAKRVCELALEFMKRASVKSTHLKLLLQSGAAHEAYAHELAKKLGLPPAQIEIKAFIHNMAEELDRADIVIARAGASTVAELCISGHPTLFVPFPFAADDHQRLNSKLLADARAAWMVDERDPTVEARFYEYLFQIIFDPHQFQNRSRMSENLKKWGRPQAARDICEEIFRLI